MKISHSIHLYFILYKQTRDPIQIHINKMKNMIKYEKLMFIYCANKINIYNIAILVQYNNRFLYNNIC